LTSTASRTNDAATLDVLIARLEARGKHPRFEMMMREYLDAMAIDSARYILDLGCGTGVVARMIARRPPFAGRVLRSRATATTASAR
jgi:predicted TPR repeat methyltransferase